MAAKITLSNGTPTPASYDYAGGRANLEVSGDWGNGIVRAEYSRDGGTEWTPLGDKIAGNAGLNFDLPACKIRVVTLRGEPALNVHIDAL